MLLATTFGLSAASFTALLMSAALGAGAVWLLSTSGAFLSPFYPTAGVILALIFVTLAKVRIERRRAETAIRKIESTILNRLKRSTIGAGGVPRSDHSLAWTENSNPSATLP
jgi:hypothetical protein